MQNNREHIAIEVLSKAFEGTPSINYLLGDHPSHKKVRALMQYMYQVGNLYNGVYFSKNRNVVAIALKKDETVSYSFKHFWLDLKFIFLIVGVLKAFKILSRQLAIIKQQQKEKRFLHFWIIGALPNSSTTKEVIEVRNQIFEMAKKEKLPILLETSIEKNKRVYERYGFKVKSTFKFNSNVLWIMKKVLHEEN